MQLIMSKLALEPVKLAFKALLTLRNLVLMIKHLTVLTNYRFADPIVFGVPNVPFI